MCRSLFLFLPIAVVAVAAVAQEPLPEPAIPDSLAAAGELERQTLDRLLGGDSWTRRALASMRLDRYRCADSRAILDGLATDDAWQVRAFAIRALGRRGETLAEDAFADEYDPKVLRAALRYGYALETDRVARGVRYLARSGDLHNKMLAVELGIASGDEALAELARETIRKIILRMGPSRECRSPPPRTRPWLTPVAARRSGPGNTT